MKRPIQSINFLIHIRLLILSICLMRPSFFPSAAAAIPSSSSAAIDSSFRSILLQWSIFQLHTPGHSFPSIRGPVACPETHSVSHIPQLMSNDFVPFGTSCTHFDLFVGFIRVGLSLRPEPLKKEKLLCATHRSQASPLLFSSEPYNGSNFLLEYKVHGSMHRHSLSFEYTKHRPVGSPGTTS